MQVRLAPLAVRPVVQVEQPVVLQDEQPVVLQEEQPVVLQEERQVVPPAEQRVAQQELLEVRPQPVVPRQQVARQELLQVPLAQSLERSVWRVL